MTTFYLSNESSTRAHGLYHYTSIGSDKYEERRIGNQGKLDPHLLGTLSVQLQSPQPWGQTNTAIDPTDWLEIPGEPHSFLALEHVPRTQPPPSIKCWQNALKTHGPRRWALPPEMRKLMYRVSTNRRNQGYGTVSKNAKAPPPDSKLKTNAEAFWNTGDRVCAGIIFVLYDSLRAPGSENSLNYPDWLFQLNRILSEGFIAGHANYPHSPPLTDPTKPGDYEVASENVLTWEIVLTRAERSTTFEQFNETASDSHPEKVALKKLGKALIPGASAKEDDYWDVALAALLTFGTPGKKDAEEFAFWNLHYPHWYVDLAGALDIHNHHLKNITKSNSPKMKDWDIIARTIMENFPEGGRTLSLGDKIMADLIREFGKLGSPLPFNEIIKEVLQGV